jgi:Tfp pilus assembly protein PilE
MPFWAWLLIDLGVLLFGLLILAWIAWDIYFKVSKISQESSELQKAMAVLQEQLETTEKYLKPADNLGDDPAKLTRDWMARKSHREHEKSAKQRRLIARFSKRK